MFLVISRTTCVYRMHADKGISCQCPWVIHFSTARPGPYICAERDGGGLPYWLYAIHPDISLRSADPRFLIRVEAWWGRLLPILRERLYENGGNVIMVQLENEYGSYGLQTGYCDIEYMNALKVSNQHNSRTLS